MADTGYVIITITKPVETKEEAKIIFDLVKTKLEDRPDVVVKGHFTNHFELTEPT